MKQRNYKKGYASYVAKFKEEKKLGNIKNGVRQLTFKQYNAVRNKDKLNNKQIIDKQVILKDSVKNKVWKHYTKVKDKLNLTRGDRSIDENTFWGESWEEDEGLGYHRTMSGLLHDRYSLHFLISNRVDLGEDRDEVLSDYGY